jgi:hypothetical protein
MDNILSYILIFTAVVMAVVFGLRSWLLAQRERRSRRLRRSKSHHFSHRFSRRSSRRFRRHSSSRRYDYDNQNSINHPIHLRSFRHLIILIHLRHPMGLHLPLTRLF